MAITTFSQLEQNTQEKFIGTEAGSDCWNVLVYLRNGLQDFAEGLKLNRDDVQIKFDRKDKWSGSIRYRGHSLLFVDCTRCVSQKKVGRYGYQKYAYKTIRFFPNRMVDSIREVFEEAIRVTDQVQIKANEEKEYIVSLYKKIMADRKVDAYGARAILDKAYKIFYDIKEKASK